jgi:dTDP-4-amino-4,6-dideoxygalactose transaminase
MISLSKVNLGPQEYFQVLLTLRSGNIAQGKKVLEFEELFASYVGHEKINCVAVNSGTSALYVALLALGIGVGDEVLLPSFSFAATANVVRLVGAKPVFCDIDSTTLTISAQEIEDKITPSTRCIIPVHIFGLPANLPKIYEIANRHKLIVIEDAAQAHGAEVFGKKIGWQADAIVYSFYPTKNITSVEGGLVLFKRSEHADFARLFRNQGMRERYAHEIVGMNLRMSDIHATVGVSQIKKLETITRARIKNADYYSMNLSSNIIKQVQPVGYKSVYHQYIIRIKQGRDEVKSKLTKIGIESGIYYPVPIHHLTPYKNLISLPVTETVCREILAIPVHGKLKHRQLKFIVKSLNAILEAYK